VPEKEDLKNYL